MAEIKELNSTNFEEVTKSGVVLVTSGRRGATRAKCSAPFWTRSPKRRRKAW